MKRKVSSTTYQHVINDSIYGIFQIDYDNNQVYKDNELIMTCDSYEDAQHFIDSLN